MAKKLAKLFGNPYKQAQPMSPIKDTKKTPPKGGSLVKPPPEPKISKRKKMK